MRYAAAVLLMVLAGCDRILPGRADTTLPPIEDVQAIYAEQGLEAEFRYSGNVVEMIVQQPADQLRRGGQLWAKVGPYIYLFSPGTRTVFEQYTGIAGVRTITMVGQTEVARALLVRDALNDYSWRRALGLLTSALAEGTTRPAVMDGLVQFGEQNTQFAYNPRYVPPRQR